MEMETKEKLRKRIREFRNGLSREQVETYSHAICEILKDLLFPTEKNCGKLKNSLFLQKKETCGGLKDSLVLQKEEIFFVYSAAQNEVNLKEIIQFIMQKERKIAFPKVAGIDMDFYEVTAATQLKPGAFGILEPDESCRKIIPDLCQRIYMLVPGVAFSETGYRIGYGKGFYDRYLARYPQIHKIGIAYEGQICEDFEKNEFDIPMDRVITEEREVIINDKS